MEKTATENNQDKKLGIKQDKLSVNILLEQVREVQKNLKKVMPNKDKSEIYGFPRQKKIKGRIYFYLVWYEYDYMGKRRQKSKYLGTSLPKGYSLGKAVRIDEY